MEAVQYAVVCIVGLTLHPPPVLYDHHKLLHVFMSVPLQLQLVLNSLCRSDGYEANHLNPKKSTENGTWEILGH